VNRDASDDLATIAVSGANGFVGRHCVERLRAAGFGVVALARERPADLPPGVEWRAAPDLGPDADWRGCIEGAQVLVHCAARVHVMRDRSADPLTEFRRANRAGTLKLAEDCVRMSVGRFVFISSIKVNGEETAPGRPFTPADEPAPSDPYGQSKLEAEQALFALGRDSGMEIVVVRPVLVYGPGVRANFRALMKAVARGSPLPIARARGQRSLVGVSNLSDLVLAGCIHPEAAGRVFLAADGEDMTSAELARRLGDALGRPARLLPVPAAMVGGAARMLGKGAAAQRVFGSLTVSIEDARRLLDWTPPVTVQEELQRTASAFRAETASDE
jgi:nucleoside-diphosphate-sugar epimerase